MATSAKRQATADRILKRNNGEPIVNPLDYRSTLIIAMNYYNANYDNKEKKKWFLAHFKKQVDFPTSDIRDYEFVIGGTLARIISNGNALEDKELTRLENELFRIRKLAAKNAIVVEEVVATPTAPKETIQDRLDKKAQDFMAEFNAQVDEYVMTRETFDPVKLLTQFQLPAPVAKKVAAKIASTAAELEEALEGEDKQLVEGYSQFKKVELRKLAGFYSSLNEALNQAKKMVVRKARKVKVKPAGEIVKRMKFLAEDAELGLKSVQPHGIVGADEVWCFNVKIKKLQAYKAMDGETLTVKGTTIMNYDTTKSVGRTVRKPEQLLAIIGNGKRVFNTFLKTLSTKDAVLNGRINQDTIILATFK